MSTDHLKTANQIAEEIISSGRYLELQTQLRQKLLKEDWYSNMRPLITDALLQSGSNQDVMRITSALEARASGKYTMARLWYRKLTLRRYCHDVHAK